MSALTGGAAENGTADPFSGGVPNTVNPADTLLAMPESSMQHTIINLSDDENELVAEAYRALKMGSKEETSERSKLHKLLKQITLANMRKQNLPVENARLSRFMAEMPPKKVFEVRVAEFVVAIQLVDSETTRHVDIIAPTATPYNWLKGTVCILPRGYMLEPKEEDTFVYMISIGFH
ncbi:hypothetical protein MY11210_009304 [Beauveria gryllotalpidicola]